MKILITGVAGAIGSLLGERLLEQGHEVVGIDSFTQYYSPQIKMLNALEVEKKGGKVIIDDLVTADLSRIVSSPDIIYHLAAQPGISATTPFEQYLGNNIVATHRLLEEAKKCPNLKMFFHISTSSVYGARADGNETAEPKPTSYYGVTKLAAEQLALSYYRELGLPVSVLRFFSVYGERERADKFFHRLIKAICEDKEVPFFQGSEHHVRSYTYVGDIVDGCILALNNLDKVNGEIFNLGTDKTTTTGDAMKIVEKIMGKSAKLKTLPRRLGDQFETAANIGKARTILGYNPSTDIETGLTQEVSWYKERIHNKLK